ncbi:nucleotidyltransferase family protein [uncultured Polaribacter sp.]|uniref:nucleotidyltransferase family protein n=1 Tax=uncultured Polaribacter sp. TaxID=174711 RepID=UPI00260A6838|nr:nucleotidyltransferase family protein [uncultured Polaribacter sp.]
MKDVAILVLAAGKSSRMKTPKQLVKIGADFLLATVLKKAKSLNTNNVYCVLGANAEKIREKISLANIHFIDNKNFDNGLSSSIVSGIVEIEKKAQKYDAVLILLADQPAIEKEYLDEMIGFSRKYPTKTIASNYSYRAGVPAIFPKEYFFKLKELTGDFGAQELLNNHKNVILFDRQTNFIDIDTEKDLKDYNNSILK